MKNWQGDRPCCTNEAGNGERWHAEWQKALRLPRSVPKSPVGTEGQTGFGNSMKETEKVNLNFGTSEPDTLNSYKIL